MVTRETFLSLGQPLQNFELSVQINFNRTNRKSFELLVFRSGSPVVFSEKGVLKNFAIFKNTYFEEHL